MRGYVVQFSARIKADGINPGRGRGNGIQFGAVIETDCGRVAPSVNSMDGSFPAAGSFDWKLVGFYAAIPPNAKRVTLRLCLDMATGKAWCDDIRVVVRKPIAAPGSARQLDRRTQATICSSGGTMVGNTISGADLRVLGQDWNANLIRWPLLRGRVDNPLDLVAYQRWLQSALEQLDAALPLCEKYGLRVVIDLHSPPGGLFSDAASQRMFIQVWQHFERTRMPSPFGVTTWSTSPSKPMRAKSCPIGRPWRSELPRRFADRPQPNDYRGAAAGW